MTTPPLPESSPSIDIMDMSPLPHKLPYSLSTEASLHSPTPEAMDSPTVEFHPSPLQASPMEDAQPAGFQEYVLYYSFDILQS